MAYERENLAVAGLSAALSLTMIAVYVLLPAMRSFPRKLLTALAILDFLSVVARFLPVFADPRGEGDPWRTMKDGGRVCIAQTALLVFSDCASFIMTAAIAVFAYHTIMLDSAFAAIENRKPALSLRVRRAGSG